MWGESTLSKGIHRLSEAAFQAALNSKADMKLPDGGGLRLDIKNGHAGWIFRYVAPGSRKDRYMGLGPARSVTLVMARRLAADARELVAKGLDPIVERDREVEADELQTGATPTFEVAAVAYIAKHEPGWKNSKHRQQWQNTLRTYAFPSIGVKTVDAITAKNVADMLQPIWLEKRETAARVRGRVEKILDAAIALEHRTTANPAAWNVQRNLLPVQKRKNKVQHHAALPYSQMPLFFRELLRDQSNAALALRFVVLTVCRYGEAAQSRWAEVDLKRRLWTVPAARMKADRPHAVPLSEAACDALREAKKRYGDKGLIFPGYVNGKPISDSALAQAIDRSSIEPATTHGMRSTFRDWAGDETDFQREVIEAALSHIVGDKAEQAYRRETALAKRRALMNTWASYCLSA